MKKIFLFIFILFVPCIGFSAASGDAFDRNKKSQIDYILMGENRLKVALFFKVCSDYPNYESLMRRVVNGSKYTNESRASKNMTPEQEVMYKAGIKRVKMRGGDLSCNDLRKEILYYYGD